MKRVLQFGMTPNYGGVEAFIMNVYRNLNHNEFQFDFLKTTDKKISYEDEIIELGGRVIQQKYYSRKKHPIKHYKELIDYFKNNPNVIAVHLNKANLIDIDLLIVAKLMKVPVRIIHSHTNNLVQKSRFIERFNRKLLKRVANYFFACSEVAGEYMFKTLKYQIIKDGVDIKKYQFNQLNRDKIRTQLEILPEDYVIGNIGRICEHKNTLFLLDIFFEIQKKLKDSKLLLIGNGPLKNDLEKKIKKLSLQENVILIPETSLANEYYSAMDVFLLPSLFEGFGMVLLEAQICGLKCFASKSVVPKMVNITGEVDFISLERTPEEWARKILECKNVERYDKIEQIKQAGFDIKEISKMLENIYLNKN